MVMCVLWGEHRVKSHIHALSSVHSPQPVLHTPPGHSQAYISPKTSTLVLPEPGRNICATSRKVG